MAFENIIEDLKDQIAKAKIAGDAYLQEHAKLKDELLILEARIQECTAEIQKAQAAIDRLEGKPLTMEIAKPIDPQSQAKSNLPAEPGFEWVDGVLRPVGWGSMMPAAQAIENQRPAFILPPVVEDASFGDPVSLF